MMLLCEKCCRPFNSLAATDTICSRCIEPEPPQCCGNCFYWRMRVVHQFGIFECRRHAPIIIGDSARRFPQTNNGDWCGDWEARK